MTLGGRRARAAVGGCVCPLPSGWPWLRHAAGTAAAWPPAAALRLSLLLRRCTKPLPHVGDACLAGKMACGEPGTKLQCFDGQLARLPRRQVEERSFLRRRQLSEHGVGAPVPRAVRLRLAHLAPRAPCAGSPSAPQGLAHSHGSPSP
jgi:hypothetical protein